MNVTAGLYRHYKGGRYKVICQAIEHDTRVSLVIYQALHGDMAILARPLADFVLEADFDGRKVPRYERIDEHGVD